jgi:cathepsin L
MFRASIVLIALIGACAALDQSLDAHWSMYKTKHGKVYDTKEDHQRRVTWEETVKMINAHNLKHDLGVTTYRMGLNKFTDMTNDEFRAFKGFRFNATAIQRRGSNMLLPPMRKAPASVDWRTKGYVTPVKDQAQCGSCWAFSATGSLEGQHFAKTGKLVSLSEQNLVDCSGSQGNMGCNGGLMDQAFEYIKSNHGIDTESSYPYTAQDGQCQFKKNSIGATCTGYVDITSGSETALRDAVATVGPVSVAIDAGHSSFQSYSSGVYDEPECSPTYLDHGVLAVGYGTTDQGVDYWIVKNSWGEVWGTKGYILMSRNKNNQCGIATQSSYPTV